MLRRACVLVFALLCRLFAAVTSAPIVQMLPAIEGGNVTFWTGLSNQTHAILSCGNVTLLNYVHGGTQQNIFKNNIYVENEAIMMTNIHQSDSNHIYELQIIWPAGKTYYYRLNVTKCEPQVSDYTPVLPTQRPDTKEKRDHATAAYIIAGLVVPGVVVSLIIYCQREKLRNKICGESPSENNGPI